MAPQKLHHYVPQFYLRRFADESGYLCLWDKVADRTFRASPKGIAAERNFYYLDEFVAEGHDPLKMEKQLSELEASFADITDQWLLRLRQMRPLETIAISDEDRALAALYIAVQSLRTADQRGLLPVLIDSPNAGACSAAEARRLHTTILWSDEVVRGLADWIEGCIWAFARNTTPVPFVTSDNPVAFRANDNSMWLKVGMQSKIAYLVFPLSPDLIMYGYPRMPPWGTLARYDRALSPVTLTEGMVISENTGQVFMASRFIISREPRFEAEQAFAKTIGTETYARDGQTVEDRLAMLLKTDNSSQTN